MALVALAACSPDGPTFVDDAMAPGALVGAWQVHAPDGLSAMPTRWEFGADGTLRLAGRDEAATWSLRAVSATRFQVQVAHADGATWEGWMTLNETGDALRLDALPNVTLRRVSVP